MLDGTTGCAYGANSGTTTPPFLPARRSCGRMPRWHVVASVPGHALAAEAALSADGWRVYHPLHLTRSAGHPPRITSLTCELLPFHKTCPGCNRWLPAGNFHLRKLSADGLTPRCRECVGAGSAARYQANREECSRKAKERYRANPEPVKAKSAKYYAENREAALAQSKQWQRDNPEKVAARNRKWVKANWQQVLEIQRRNYAANREREIAYVQRRHAMTRSKAGADLITITALIDRDGPNCYICKIETKRGAKYSAPDKAQIEHVTPLNRGGAHTWENVRVACRRCNMLKSDKFTPEEVVAMVAWQ